MKLIGGKKSSGKKREPRKKKKSSIETGWGTTLSKKKRKGKGLDLGDCWEKMTFSTQTKNERTWWGTGRRASQEVKFSRPRGKKGE